MRQLSSTDPYIRDGCYSAKTGEGDLVRLESWFDDRSATDPGFKQAVDQGKLSKRGFRNYYGLRASVGFSMARMTNGTSRA